MPSRSCSDIFRNSTTACQNSAPLVDGRNLPWLFLAIGCVKILHELGHAMTCKHFGGEVHEMGFMLLVFSPCLYCDVSDAWRLRSKWQRIAVSAAGMIVELVLAALATIVWWYAQPGVVQLVALNIMIICTVNTLLINGNPLMRYDGYFIFSDLVETPNLWQRSREAFRYFWSDWLLGQPVVEDPLIPINKPLALGVRGCIQNLYGMHMRCDRVGAHQSALPIPFGKRGVRRGVHGCRQRAYRAHFRRDRTGAQSHPRAELRTGRLGLITLLALALIVAGLAIPIDYQVRAPLILMPDDAARVYATVDGTLTKVLPSGTKVTRGQTIGQLTNPEVQIEITHLEGELKVRQLHVEHLEKLRGVDTKANDEIPTAQTVLADSRRRLDERLSVDEKRLTLSAPVDGFIIDSPRKPEADQQTPGCPAGAARCSIPNQADAR